MDELKLDAWRKKFNDEARKFLSSRFTPNNNLPEKFYALLLNESSELTIEVNDGLPKDIKEKLEQMLITTKPEDSI